MLAVEVLLLLHVPPLVASASVVDAPEHITDAPVIATGFGLMVICCVTTQPVGSVYLIVGVPAAFAVTSPVEEPIEAIALLLLVHVPPAGVEFNVPVLPTQYANVPVIAVGGLLTVTAVV
jgi:hypothetical protein